MNREESDRLLEDLIAMYERSGVASDAPDRLWQAIQSVQITPTQAAVEPPGCYLGAAALWIKATVVGGEIRGFEVQCLK